jgi:hypothetical protein
MLGAWPIVHRRKSPATSARAWKPPDLTCWLCFALWTACIYRRARSHNGFFDNFLSSTPIMRRLFGHWTSLSVAWTATPCCATRSLHWTGCRQHVPIFERDFRHVPIPSWPNWNLTSGKHCTRKRPTTWCQAKIPKTFRHPAARLYHQHSERIGQNPPPVAVDVSTPARVITNLHRHELARVDRRCNAGRMPRGPFELRERQLAHVCRVTS